MVKNVRFMLKLWYAGFLGQSPFSHFGTIHFWNMRRSRKLKKTRKPPILRTYCHSRSSTLTPLKAKSLVFVMTSSMSVPICNCFHARRANRSKITTTFQGYHSLTPACTGLFELWASAFKLLKFAFNTKSFIRWLSWSISNKFVPI